MSYRHTNINIVSTAKQFGQICLSSVWEHKTTAHLVWGKWKTYWGDSQPLSSKWVLLVLLADLSWAFHQLCFVILLTNGQTDRDGCYITLTIGGGNHSCTCVVLTHLLLLSHLQCLLGYENIELTARPINWCHIVMSNRYNSLEYLAAPNFPTNCIGFIARIMNLHIWPCRINRVVWSIALLGARITPMALFHNKTVTTIFNKCNPN